MWHCNPRVWWKTDQTQELEKCIPYLARNVAELSVLQQTAPPAEFLIIWLAVSAPSLLDKTGLNWLILCDLFRLEEKESGNLTSLTLKFVAHYPP